MYFLIRIQSVLIKSFCCILYSLYYLCSPFIIASTNTWTGVNGVCTSAGDEENEWSTEQTTETVC